MRGDVRWGTHGLECWPYEVEIRVVPRDLEMLNVALDVGSNLRIGNRRLRILRVRRSFPIRTPLRWQLCIILTKKYGG